jgi:hypothetical protein
MNITMRSRLKTLATLSFAVGCGSASFAQQVENSALTASGSPVELVRAESSLSSQANHLNQNQWIRIADEGSIRGSVSTLIGSQIARQGKVKIALVQDGKVVREGLTDVEGDFMIEKATPGVYSLVSVGDELLAVCSLTVLSKKDGNHLPDRAHILAMSPATPRVAELIRSNTMPTWTVGGQPSSDPIAPIRNFEGSCEVRIDARGGISGTLSRANATVDLSGTVVYLVRDGQEIARTRASSNGSYRFESVAPGSYGLVASGSEGIAAVGFTAVAGDMARLGRLGDTVFVRQQPADPATIPAPASTAKHLNVELAEPNCFVPAEVIPVDDCIVTDTAAACPTMGGCCGGGFTGGGGGGGGYGSGMGGGWGTLAAIGALTAVAISQALDDDEAPIVSPIVK